MVCVQTMPTKIEVQFWIKKKSVNICSQLKFCTLCLMPDKTIGLGVFLPYALLALPSG